MDIPGKKQAISATSVYRHKEVEDLLMLSKNTVNELLRSGRLRSVKVGRIYRVPGTALIEFLEGRN